MNTRKTAVFGLLAVLLTLAFIACEQPTDNTPTLTGITAVYNQTAAVYPTTPLNNLKAGLTVTAKYSDNTGKTLNSADYSLSGDLSASGQKTVTVTYEGKTTTFTVNVAAAPVTYTVTFNANGATSGTAPTAQTASSGSSITLPNGSGLTKSGYTFGGWNTNTEGAGTNYSTGSSYRYRRYHPVRKVESQPVHRNL